MNRRSTIRTGDLEALDRIDLSRPGRVRTGLRMGCGGGVRRCEQCSGGESKTSGEVRRTLNPNGSIPARISRTPSTRTAWNRSASASVSRSGEPGIGPVRSREDEERGRLVVEVRPQLPELAALAEERPERAPRSGAARPGSRPAARPRGSATRGRRPSPRRAARRPRGGGRAARADLLHRRQILRDRVESGVERRGALRIVSKRRSCFEAMHG